MRKVAAMEVDGLDVESHECRTCGETCEVAKDILQTASLRSWIEKTLSLKFGIDGKSNFVCSGCADKINTWIRFRSKFNITQKKLELLIKQAGGSTEEMTNRVQRRLGEDLSETTEVDVKPKLPMRIKVEPKVEADLFNTYGYTGINIVAPVQIKEEIKEEPQPVCDVNENSDVDNDDDERDKAPAFVSEPNKRRLEAIRLKFKKIGDREKKKKIIREQKMLLEGSKSKMPRENLPTKNARKISPRKKPVVDFEVLDDPDDPEEQEPREVEKEVPAAPAPEKKKNRPMPLSKKKLQDKSASEEGESSGTAKKACLPASLKRTLAEAEKQVQDQRNKVSPEAKKSKTLLDYYSPKND